MVKDARSLFPTVARRLSASPDRKIEALRWRAARGEALERSLSPARLALLTGEDEAWAIDAFADLAQCGFIQTQVTGYTWGQFDAVSIGLEFDVLSSIEAIVALRFEYAEFTRIGVELRRQVARITDDAAANDLLGACLKIQRLLLTLVAAADAGELMREYAACARPALAYAWAIHLSVVGMQTLVATLCDIVSHLEAGRGQRAAGLLMALRHLPESSSPAAPRAL